MSRTESKPFTQHTSPAKPKIVTVILKPGYEEYCIRSTHMDCLSRFEVQQKQQQQQINARKATATWTVNIIARRLTVSNESFGVQFDESWQSIQTAWHQK